MKELDLNYSVLIFDDDLEHIARAWPGLRTLKLKGVRVSAECLQSIAKRLRQLEVLEIAFTRCNDLVVDHICQNMAATLRRLNVAGCESVTDQCVCTVAMMLTNLQSLDVSKCHQLSSDGFISLVRLNKTLRYLDVSKTAISGATLTQLRSSLPACNIVHEDRV